MTAPHYVQLAAEAMARAHRDDPPLVPAPDRARAIREIERALRARRYRRTVRQYVDIGAVATVSVALALAHVRSETTSGSSKRSDADAPTHAPRRVSPPTPTEMPSRDAVTLSGDGTQLLFAMGARMTIDDGGNATIQEGRPATVVTLSAGSVRTEVRALPEGEQFLVRDSDIEVETTNAVFRVAHARSTLGCGSLPRVFVDEGSVTVRRAATVERVGPGESWPRSCEPSSLPRAPMTAARQTPRASSKGPEVSELRDQNDLFAEGVSAKRRGELWTAIAHFDALVGRYPASALAESAAVQRMRLLRTLDHGRAIEAARAYRDRYSEGFGRSEADAILAEPPARSLRSGSTHERL